MIPAILVVALLVPVVAAGGTSARRNGDLPVPSSVSLYEAVRYALAHSREGRVAERDVRTAEEGRTQATAGRLPRLDADAGYRTYSEAPGVLIQSTEVQTMESSVVNARVTARQTIFDFGKTGARVSQADARIDAATGKSEATKERIAFGVISAFLDARRADQLRQVAEESLAAAREHRKVAGDLYDLGVVARNDVLAADVRVAREEGILVTAENRVELARSRLALRMGFSGENAVVPEPGDFPVPEGEPPLSESLRVAMEKRPELKAQEAAVREGEAGVSAARAEFAPTLYGEGGYLYDSNSYNPNPNTFTLLLGGKINLFSGFSDEAAKRTALLGVESRKDELALLRDEIALSVKRAHLAVAEAETKKSIAEVAVGQAEENLRIQNNRYREGLAISTEVLDAQTLVTEAKVVSYNATFDLFESRYNLLVERGELLEFLDPLLGAGKGQAMSSREETGQGR
ncbi:MAG: TolC family protein [Thermodesulfobacteriota bacterium]|nr:TolC family protein [Thermodesulfobacteriota bacterium]